MNIDIFNEEKKDVKPDGIEKPKKSYLSQYTYVINH